METTNDLVTIAEQSESLFTLMFGIVHTEEWKTYEFDNQKIVRSLVEQYYAAASIIREKFDSDVWKGHANGTVSPEIESVRKQREGDTPGKKAEPVTPASLLKKRLSKKG